MINCSSSLQSLQCLWEQKDSIYDESTINSCFDGVRETENSKNMKAAAKAIFLDADDLTKTQWKAALGFTCLIAKFDELHEKGTYEIEEGFDAIETCFAGLKENPKFSSLISTIYGAFSEVYYNKQQITDSQ